MLLIVACSTTKKVVQSNEANEISTQKTEVQSTSTDKLIDTTKTDKGKITITEIEFYPPTESAESKPLDEKQSSKPSTNVSGLSLPNVGNIGNAAIKSIKQTTIEAESEKKGESKESSSTNHQKNEAVVAKNEKAIQSEVMPAPDPYRWRYIFYIMLLAAIAFLYLKRVPVLNWIKTILSGIRRIF
jgi:hypothetical protein